MRKRRHRQQPYQIQKKDSFFKSSVQKKLNIGKPGDKYEVEADAMANKVTNKGKSDTGIQKKNTSEEDVQTKPIANTITSFVQRMETSNDKSIQAKCNDCKKEAELVQAKPDSVSNTPSIMIQKEERGWPFNGRVTNNSSNRVRAFYGDQHYIWVAPGETTSNNLDIDFVQALNGRWYKIGPYTTQINVDGQISRYVCPCTPPPIGECLSYSPEHGVPNPDAGVQKMEEENVQTKSNSVLNPSSNRNIESRLKSKSGRGNKIDKATKHDMEKGFGVDFSKVNIHNDSQAAQMSQDIGAQAFTHGNDIYFNKGKYNPNTKDGKHLLAHELTHTIQQGKTNMIQASFEENITVRRQYYRTRNFTISDGDVTVTSNAQWDRGATHCGRGDHTIELKSVGTLWDSSYGTKNFSSIISQSKTWSNLPNGNFYLVISHLNTNPNCLIHGSINVQT